MAKGTNTASVIASCMILSCGSVSAVKPMRLAGTCSRYSKRAMPQLASAATHQGQVARFLRWAYQAKVMNTLEAASSAAAATTGESWITRASPRPGSCILPGGSAPALAPEPRRAARSRPMGAARKRARASAGAESSGAEDPARARRTRGDPGPRSEEHTSELQSLAYLVCRLLLEKKK